MSPTLRRLAPVLLTGLMCLAAAVTMSAQRRYGGGLPAANKPFTYNGKYDGRFRFVRLTYTCGGNCYYYRREAAWEHGYPLSEQNLMQIMEAITALDPHVEDSMVLGMEDPELFKYPVSYMTEASFWITNDRGVVPIVPAQGRVRDFRRLPRRLQSRQRRLGQSREQHGARAAGPAVGGPDG
jgi:hypothetical protein